ncbi:PilW family protein [Kushneria phosphatilytica]|uniref:Uncharacterized protein n=1 Tax=Kushneria phosphatilytica TaxID=657387 RepID=A0A1S1NR38_9GAMM|nr:PilW family protein [Kushneria phosphatilytica]OHV11491.1 hypothetical protein BH688_06945 [Kushneria phosphatilytica]QEL12087.1 hypothetical protein FY550_13705 [Kushneria phosphatilytica]
MRTRQLGAGLLELMVALAVGMLVITGAVNLYLHTIHASEQQQALSDIQARGRLVTRLLSEELRRTGYWGRELTPYLDNAADLPAISHDELLQPVWAGSLAQAEQKHLIPGSATLTRVDTDATLPARVLVVRYVRSDDAQGSCFRMSGHELQLMPGTSCSDRYYAALYYLRDVSDAAEGHVPALMMRQLDENGAWTNSSEVVRGVEALSLEWGLDSDRDGTANRYVTDDLVSDWNAVVSVRLFIVLRSPALHSHVNALPLRLSGKAITLDDQRLRRVFVTTVTMRNARARLREGS